MAEQHSNSGRHAAGAAAQGLRALVIALVTLVAVGVAAPAAAAPSPRDVSYLVTTHQDHLYAIAAGTLAAQRGTNPEVRRLGQQFVDDHRRLDAELVALAKQLNVPLTNELNDAQQAVLKELAAAPAGTAFDRLWITRQIEAQNEMYSSLHLELSYGYDPRVKNLARDASDVIREHIAALDHAATLVNVPTS
jgi:predicted outer membrane protein